MQPTPRIMICLASIDGSTSSFENTLEVFANFPAASAMLLSGTVARPAFEGVFGR
jgi:hypothetical protein